EQAAIDLRRRRILQKGRVDLLRRSGPVRRVVFARQERLERNIKRVPGGSGLQLRQHVSRLPELPEQLDLQLVPLNTLRQTAQVVVDRTQRFARSAPVAVDLGQVVRQAGRSRGILLLGSDKSVNRLLRRAAAETYPAQL